uniref:Cardiomyopathy associated 5 n=1 Tax=Strigops habroptila TaxID=2489341 RepID=A0A672UJW5_STRHB
MLCGHRFTLFCGINKDFTTSALLKPLLKDVIQSEDVKPKLQYIMTNPSFSMVTVQSEDSGITWETSSSRCSTPWASETSTTSDIYSMESSPVGSPPGKVIFIMDEGKIVRKRKRKTSNRAPVAMSLKGGQGNKKRDSSGMQRQEPRTVLGDVQASVLNVEQVEAQDTDEEMDDKEDVEDITEEPVKRAPIRSIFRENRLRKVGPILGGPVQARIQLFNSIFGGTPPDPEALEKTRIQRSSSVSGDSEQFLETSVKERLQKFRSVSEATHPKTFQRTGSRNLETPSERRREQRQQPSAHADQSCSSPTMPLEKRLNTIDDVSSENIKPTKMKDKPSRFSSFVAETTLQHEKRKDIQPLSLTPDQVSGDSLNSCPPEEVRKPQSHSPVAEIPEQTTSVSSQSGDKSEKQVPLPSAENANKKPDQSLLKASDNLDEPEEQELQPSSAPQSVSDNLVDELDRQSTQPILPTASVSEHPEREAQKSAVESHLPSAPSAKSKYSTLSETKQEDIIPQSPETAQSESKQVFLPHSADETEKKETECPSSTTGLSEAEPSGLLYSAKKKEDQRTPPLETQNVHLEKQMKSEQNFSSSLQKTEEERIKLKPPIPEKIDSKYFGISYPVHTETEETQKTQAINKAVDLDHPDFSVEKTKEAKNLQMEMEHPDFSYSSKEIGESERTQMETEHPDFSFSKKEAAELEGVQMEMEHPDFSFSREEMEKSESTQLEAEHPDLSYSREETVESESPQLEMEHPDFSFSREEIEGLESVQLGTEHLDFSYSSKEIAESESGKLKMEHPDLSYSREEMEESESVQIKMGHPDFSFSREKIEDLEGVQLETEHPDFSHSSKETGESESGQLKMEHIDFPYSREEMEESENAQIEMGHPDFSFSREEVEKSESAQLEMKHQEFLFSGEKTEKEKSVPFEVEQPESYSPEEVEQEESAQLAVVPSDLSCLMEEAEKENTAEIQLVHPDIIDSTGKAETQKTGYLETTRSDLPHPMNKSKQQVLAEADLGNSHASYFGDKGEQLQPGQQDSQPGGKLYSCAKGVQGETAQLHSEHLVLSYATGKEQQHKTSQVRAKQPEASYSTGKTEQQEILLPKLEQGDSPYSQGETTQETVQRDSEGSEPSCFISEQQQHENVQLASENKGFSFTTGEVMQEGVETGSLGSSHLAGSTKPWEMAQMEQEQLIPSCSSAGSQQQETPPRDMVQPDISYSSGRMEQQNIVQRELEQHETAQQKAMQIEMEYSDLSETWQKEEPQVIDRITLAQQEIAEPELVHPSLPYSFREKIQEEMQTEPAYQEQTFYVSTEMQEEMTQHKSEQPCLSHFTGKTEQQEIVHPEPEQTVLPSSSGKESPLEMKMSSGYLDLSYTLSKTEQQQKKSKHPTLPFHLKQQETAPLVMKHPDFSCDSGETKPGNIAEPDIGQSELSYSMRETQQSEHLDSPGTLSQEVQDERMGVESEYSNLSCSDGQTNQQETSQLDSKYPELSFSCSKAQEQETQEFESKYQELPEVARKRACPATAQIDSKHPDLTYSHGKPDDPEIAAWEMKHPNLSHSTDETNQQEVVLLDQKQRKISVGREKQKQTRTQQLEQEKLSHTPGKTEQLKHAQEDLEQPDLSFSIDRSEDEMASQEAEHTDVVYPLDNTEVRRRVQQTEQTYPFGKAKQTVQPEVEIPHSAHSMGLAKEEKMAEPGQGGADLPYSLSKAGGLQTTQVKPEQPVPSTYSLNKLQETTQLGLEQPDAFYVRDKIEQLPPVQLEPGHADLASPADTVGLRGMEHTALARPNEGQSVSRAEHPQAAEEKLEAPDAPSHSGKVEQREMAKPEPRYPDLPYSIDKTQTQEATELVLGNPDISRWPGKTEQAQTAQEEQPGFLHSFKKGGQGKKAQPELGHSQLPYSVSEAEQEAAHVKSNRSDLSAGRLEHHETIEPEAEIMDLSCSIGETQQHQIAEVDLEYPDSLHSTGTVQQQEKIQSEQEQLGDFSSSLSREEQWKGGRMQAEHHELQCSMGKREGLESSQPRSKYADLSFSVGTAEPHKTTQPELKGHDLLQPFVKTKSSRAAPLGSEHPDISDATAKVQHTDLSSVSEEKRHAQLEVKQERQSYTLYPEETVRLKLEQPMFSSSYGTAEQPYRAPLEGEFPEFLYSSGKKEQQEMAKQELEHSDLSYSTHKPQEQETTQLGVGQPDLSSYPGNTEEPQTVQMGAEHQDLPHFIGKTEWQGTAQPEVEHPDLSYSNDKIEQPPATQWKSEQPVRPHPIGKTKQQGMAQPEQEPPSSSYSICETLSQEATQMNLEQQDLTYAFGKTDEIRIEQGELEHTSSLYSSGKREQEMVLPELWHPQLSYPVREIEEEATEKNYPDLSYSIGQQERHEIEQPKEEMDLSYPAGKSEHSKPSQEVLQQQELLESFSKVEEKGMAQPGFLQSFGEEKQKAALQLDLMQPGLSHLLAKPEKQETAQAGFVPSDFSYSTGKSEQLQPEQLKSECPDFSYSLGKAETHGMKPPGLSYSCGRAEQPQTAQLEHPETSYFMGKTERSDGAQPELQSINVRYSVVETEQPEKTPVSYTSGRIKEQGTAKLDFERSDSLSPTDKGEKHEMALLRAGLSEKRDSGATASLTAQLETEEDFSFSTEEAESQKIQLYSSLTEQTVSLDVSHSVSETKPEESPKSSPATGGLSPKHLDLSYTHSKTEQSETAQPESGCFFSRKQAENIKNEQHLPLARQSEAEHANLPEREREQTPHYFHTSMQLESEQLNLPYSTDKAETLESQDYLTVPSKMESEPSVPFYSADETCQQEIPPYSKPAPEYLVPTWSLAEQEKQSMQPVISESAQSECRHVIPPHDEKELQKTQLCSPKPASFHTVQLESTSLTHTQGQDEQQSQDRLLDPKYLSSEQLRSPPKFPTEQGKQEMQPDVQTVRRLVTTDSKVTAVADQQAVLSGSFVPFQTLPEKSVSVAFTDDEEKQNIPSSLSDVVGMLGKQSNTVSGICTEGEDRHEVQRYFADQKHAPLEHLGVVSSDLVDETVTHKTQHYYEGSLSSAEMKSISSCSDEKQDPDAPSFGLASWLAEEVKACSISPIRTAEVDRKENQLSPNQASDFGSKQFPAGSCTELTVHGATKNKGHMFRVSNMVSSEISYGMSSGTNHRTQRYDLPSLVGDNPGPDKVPERETSTGNPTKMEAMKHPEVDTVPEVPEHYLKGEEEEIEQVSVLVGSQHAPETTEQKDLFNIISEGYEILNIHVPTHISSVDQEESKYMPDKLEYLETNPSFKRKLADDSHRAQASGTTTEISESSVLGKPASHELKELVKNDDVEESEETQENPMLPENDYAVLDPNNGMADMDYFEKYTLIDDKSPIKPHFERPRSLFPVTEDPNEAMEEATSFKESTEGDNLEEEFSLLEDLDEVFYGTVKGESKIQSYTDVSNPLPLQKAVDTSSKSATILEDERKSPGTPLFDSEEGVLERSLLFPTTVAAVNPELLEEPPALSFLYKDLYAEAVGEKTKDETPSDEESGNSNASFPSRNSDTDDGTGIYFEKYILKDEIPSKAVGPEKDQMPEDESFSGGISVQIPEDKHKQGPGDFEHVRTEVLPERSVVEREKVQIDTDIKATICKPMHAIPFGTVPQMEKYVPYVRAPVEDSEDDQYAQENLSCVSTIQQIEKPDIQQREEQHPDVYEDLAESMDYDVITQEELLQDEISSQLTHEELLFEDRDSFEHAGDSYEFVDEPEQRTPVELEDSGFVVTYPEKSATNIPQVESPQRELKKVQADTYCYHCKCPISAIDKLFGEHKDHEVTTLDDAATKMKDQLSELLIALEEKSMKIEEFVSDIESLFNSVEENCKKNAELLEKQNEEMLKKVVAQYDEKSENFEEVKKMKMEYLYEQMVNFQQTVDAAKETLETTVKEMEQLDGFVFLNTAMCFLPNRLLCAMDTTLSLEKLPSAFLLFEQYADSPGQSNQHSLKHVAAPQTPTVIPQEPNSATSTSIAVYWTVNDGDVIDCFQVYCMEELQANKDAGEYRVTVKESHCILEDLEPDHCYSVWVMAVNGTGCSLPSEKAIFKTAPSVPTIKAEDCTVCWDTATVRWCPGSASVESFTLEYCRQHSPEGEGLRSVSFAGIKRPELKVSLEPNVNYFFYLRAVNPFGTSEQSEAALISTKGTRFRLLSNTAHPALQISSNATVICLPEKAKFAGFPSVLGELLPAQGRHYWEIVVSSCRRYRIGICYNALSQSSILGMSDTSWCMRCCPTQTRFLHSGVMSDVRVTEHPARIGILLDYSGSRLLFFNAERGLVLFTIRHKFTDAAHPAFALEKAGVLTLCTGMELPDFVKHS